MIFFYVKCSFMFFVTIIRIVVPMPCVITRRYVGGLRSSRFMLHRLHTAPVEKYTVLLSISRQCRIGKKLLTGSSINTKCVRMKFFCILKIHIDTSCYTCRHPPTRIFHLNSITLLGIKLPLFFALPLNRQLSTIKL